MVLWLEQNKLKKASSNVVNELKNTNSNNWSTSFTKYRAELKCPHLETTQEQLQWLLGYAVQIETQKNSKLPLLCKYLITGEFYF